MSAPSAMKESVAVLAQAERHWRNVKVQVERAQLKGVVTSTHLQLLAKATHERDFALECFLVAWGAWVEDSGYCPSCCKPGSGFCADCQAKAESLPAGGVR